MSTFSFLPVLIQLIHSANYECNQINCNREFVFNEATPATKFMCDVEGDCDGLVIYYAGSSQLDVFCSGKRSCNGIKVFCGEWDPITDINANVACAIHCESSESPACVNVLFSCKAYSNQIDECWIGSTNTNAPNYNLVTSTMECNIGSGDQYCEVSCIGDGCQQNDVLCHTGSGCWCGEGNCEEVAIQHDATYSPTTTTPTTSNPTSSPITTKPTSSPTLIPTTKTPTKQPTFSPITAIPTKQPSLIPTVSPTKQPTSSPNTASPTTIPTTSSPTTKIPTSIPTYTPTNNPTTDTPTTNAPTQSPTIKPTNNPTTDTPTTNIPTQFPTNTPITDIPTIYQRSTAKSITNYPTTSKPTEADGNVGDNDTTMIDSDDQGENEESNVGNDGGWMEDKMLLIIGGCLVLMIIICMVMIILYCREKKRHSALIKLQSIDLRTPTETIEMERIDVIKLAATLPPQPQIMNTTDNNHENEVSELDGDEDSVNAMYIETNTVVTPSGGGGDVLDGNTNMDYDHMTAGYDGNNGNRNNEMLEGDDGLKESDEEMDDEMYMRSNVTTGF